MDASKVPDLSEIKRSGIWLCGNAPPVLIPADGSELSQTAIDYGTALAKSFNGKSSRAAPITTDV
jgi:hypothetical protein